MSCNQSLGDRRRKLYQDDAKESVTHALDRIFPRHVCFLIPGTSSRWLAHPFISSVVTVTLLTMTAGTGYIGYDMGDGWL